MKRCKRAASLLLALVMALAMMVPASAAGTGSITIDKAVPGETYHIYKIFDLEGYDGDAYAYTIAGDSPWRGFVTGSGAGAAYVTVDAQGYVKWTYTGYDTMSEDDKAVVHADFAKAALFYAQDAENSISAADTKEAEETAASVTFRGLDLGYYLVDSSLGALAILDSTAPDFSKDEKNEVPAVDKKVQTGPNAFDASSSADIGQEVTFQTTITAKKGALNYVLHDAMTGLSFKAITSVQWQKAASYDSTTQQYTYGNPSDIGTDNYTLATPAAPAAALSDGCAFELSFKQPFLDTLDTADQIVVTYTATVNTDAVVGGSGNPNQTHLTYGSKNSATSDAETRTYTYSFDLVKTKSDDTLLAGAQFRLYSSEACDAANEIALVQDGNDYRVATDAEKSVSGFTSAVIEAGKVTVKGLGNGTYYLKEIQQPSGYNKLDAPIAFTITDKNLTAAMTNDSTYGSGGVQVVNKTGTELPTTGGMGTTVFYALGGALMAGAAVLLITKKRTGRTGK